MKVSIERTALLRALGHLHRIVERRNTIPILSNILLEAADGKLGLKSTDLDLEATEGAPADILIPGATTVPAHMFYEITRKLPEGAQVSLDASGETGQLTFQSGRSRFVLPTLPASDFPDLTHGEFQHSFSLPAVELKRLIEGTQFAISTEETRYYLNGIFCHAVNVEGKPMLRAAATDGHRLARVETAAPKGAEELQGVIVPRKAVAEVLRLLEDPSQDVGLEISPTKARFHFADVTLTTKLIDGTFPDYQRVIPQNNNKKAFVDKEAFRQAVDRVSTISMERGRAIKLSISNGRMVLTVNTPESGSASEELEVEFDSSPIDIGFNARYLLDIVGQIGGDQVLIALSDAGAPTIISDPRRTDALYVLMPLRV